VFSILWREVFAPPKAFTSTVFKTAAIEHEETLTGFGTLLGLSEGKGITGK
jgi:hypothetical protein